jgi:HPt (histidine-containing phosphotransfer) domain-containing protein
MHAIKGVSGNLSMTKLYEISKAVYESKDSEYKKQNLPEVITLLEDILDELCEFKKRSQEQDVESLTKEEALELVDTHIEKLGSSSFINDSELERLYTALASISSQKHLNDLKDTMGKFDYKRSKAILEEIKRDEDV